MSERKHTVIAIIQARMASTRLPGKVLADIAGRPMLWHVVNRVRMAQSLDSVVVGTSRETVDDAIAQFCQMHHIECYRGSETDVLDRFYRAAVHFAADTIVRITADCPLIDPHVIDKVVETYRAGAFDYATNTLRYTYPDGLDTEVCSVAALGTAWKEAQLPSEREHVTSYLRSCQRFRIANIENESDLSAYNFRWTVDEAADLDFVRTVYCRMWSNHHFLFFLEDILQLLENEPELVRMNHGILRNEGYYTSFINEPPVAIQSRTLKRSYALKAKAERLIPSCSQTFSKAPSQFVQGVAPVFLERGQGSHVWDVDGNKYIDYAMALGPVVLGHNYPSVTKAVAQQMENGTVFSLPHPLEIEVAEALTMLIPCAEMVRFGKNGSDVTAGAVRVARAYTGRDVIACCGYHGWQDWYIGTTSRNRGVPKAVQALTCPFAFNDIDSVRQIFAQHPGQVAAVIMEPMGVVVPQEGFLEQIRDLTRREGALLIFDEVVTGFRVSLDGAQGYFGVTPDLACFGKGMANGYPLAAVVGRREIMELFDEIFFSFTFGGETLSLAAARATMAEMCEKKVIVHLWDHGQRLQDGYNTLARAYGIAQLTECIGLPPRTVVSFRNQDGTESLLLKSLFQQECVQRGVLFSGGHNLSFSHSVEDIDYTLRVYRTALEIIADAIAQGNVDARLNGTPVEPVFRRP
jgi:glutamate-1-semialdehyde 2,1-aminomutase/spore coat polysaccharide biosynthesis protein SpsF